MIINAFCKELLGGKCCLMETGQWGFHSVSRTGFWDHHMHLWHALPWRLNKPSVLSVYLCIVSNEQANMQSDHKPAYDPPLFFTTLLQLEYLPTSGAFCVLSHTPILRIAKTGWEYLKHIQEMFLGGYCCTKEFYAFFFGKEKNPSSSLCWLYFSKYCHCLITGRQKATSECSCKPWKTKWWPI